MHEFSCKRAGAACNAQLTAPGRDELMRQVSDHLTQVHHVQRPTKSILSYLATTVQQTGRAAR